MENTVTNVSIEKITFAEAYPLMTENFTRIKDVSEIEGVKKKHTEMILKELFDVYGITLTEKDLSAPYPVAPEKLQLLRDAKSENEIRSIVNEIISAMAGLGEASKEYQSNKSYDFTLSSGDPNQDKRVTLAYLQMNKALALGTVDANETLENMPSPSNSNQTQILNRGGVVSLITKAMKKGIDIATPVVIKAVSNYVANCSQTIFFPPFSKAADGHMLIVNETFYEFDYVDDYSKHGKGTTLSNSIAKAVISEPWDDDDPIGTQTYASVALIECSKVDSGLIGVEFGVVFEAKKINLKLGVGMSVPFASGHNKGIVMLGNNVSAKEVAETVDDDGVNDIMVYVDDKISVELKVSSGSGGTPRYIVRIYNS